MTERPHWQVRKQRPNPQTTLVSFIDADAQRMTVEEFLVLLESDAPFRTAFTDVLTQTHPGPIFFEMPPIRGGQLGAELEFAIVQAPALAKTKSNPKPFAEHFRPGERMAVFPNVGEDATLIAPCPTAELAWYAHLAVFLRSARPVQIHALWTAVARTIRSSLTTAPLSISTSGLGVPWLHVRVSSTPKYYNYVPYTRG